MTLDDLFKELVMRELPPSVRHSLVDRVDTLSAQETAVLADRYFDKDGKQLHTVPSVSAVQAEEPDVAEYPPENAHDINAVHDKAKRRFPTKAPYTPAFNPASTPQRKSSFPNKPTQQYRQPQTKPFPNRPKPSLKSICHRHAKFGDETKFCEPGCMHYAAWSKKSENGQAGWRK